MKNTKPIKIGRRLVGPGYPAYIIFEVASTHANDWNLASAYVKQAKEAGADAVKFQLFTADGLLNPISSILRPTYEYFKTAETPRDWFPKLKKLCQKEGIDLLCTPFDEDAATFLNDLGLPAVKIASGDLTNFKLLEHVARFEKPVILSTGMTTVEEIKQAVKILLKSGCRELALLQCVSVYPMPYEAANVRVMQTYKDKFNSVVGYSDNGSKGILVPLVAVAHGASVIEKHVTSQKQRGSMDDVFSISVEEFSEMVKRIRKGNTLEELKKEFGNGLIEQILGKSDQKPAKAGIKREDGTLMQEADERHWARRGLYPKKHIKKGVRITSDMLVALRPDVGISSIYYQNLIGASAQEDLPAKHPLKLEDQSVSLFRKSDIDKVYIDPSEKQFVEILTKTATFE